MLQPDFTVESHPQDCSKIILRDVTPNYGAIEGNIERADVVQVGLRIEFPDGSKRDFISKWTPALGDYSLSIFDTPPPENECGTSLPDSAYSPVSLNYHTSPPFSGMANCGCQYEPGVSGRFTAWPDGEYRMRYDVYSKVGIPDTICTYKIETKVCTGDIVYALKNGGWWDITSLGTIVDGLFSFTAGPTADEYTSYRVLSSSQTFIKEGPSRRTCSAILDTTHTSTIPVLLRSVTKRFLLSCQVDNRLAKAGMLFTVGAEESCDLNELGIKKGDVQGDLLMSFIKLDSLRGIVSEKDPLRDSNPACTGSVLKEIHARLDRVERYHHGHIG